MSPEECGMNWDDFSGTLEEKCAKRPRTGKNLSRREVFARYGVELVPHSGEVSGAGKESNDYVECNTWKPYCGVRGAIRASGVFQFRSEDSFRVCLKGVNWAIVRG